MQKAIWVSSKESFKDLNDQLSKGWVVEEMCPMPSSIGSHCSDAGGYTPSCLVIIKKG